MTNNAVHGREDLPESAEAVLFRELERLGVETPLAGFDKRAWEEPKVLVEVIANIAPWYLAEGGVQGDELKAELSEAARKVRNGIEMLEAGPNGSSTTAS